ncbi:MAG: phosphoribosylglycinamide formyltransferase [Parvibaculales bacterium]
MVASTNIAVLFSGRGSNLKALIDHIRYPEVPAEIVLGLCNNPGAGGLQICADNNIATKTVNHRDFADREAFDAALDAALVEAGTELICAAGFMRLLTPGFVDKWRDRILNIHPALLPKHKGLNTHQRVLDAGDTEHGCTVHLMRPEMDEGPILVQKKLTVLDTDTAETLAQRVIQLEHTAFPEAVDLMLTRLTS